MKYWTEMRTALMLARLGTVSAAAKELGVHRATVNRHIDTLEGLFDTPLFQRHARGYTLTDTGRDMFKAAEHAEEILNDVLGRSKNHAAQMSGKLILTAISGVGATIMPTIRDFHRENPNIDIEFNANPHLARLEYGEAHIAFRTGAKPSEPDYVVRPYRPIRMGLYASREYIDLNGHPNLDNLEGHLFVGPKDFGTHSPYADWLSERVAPEAYAFKSNEHSVRRMAICKGLGIGFMDDQEISHLKNLVEIMPPSDAFSINIWVVTHMDLHRTTKVQAFLKHLRQA